MIQRFKRMLCMALGLVFLCACSPQSTPTSQPNTQDFTSASSSEAPIAVPSPDQFQTTDTTSLVYRAMWVSYLEWANFDTTNAATFTQSVATLLDQSKSVGTNCVIVQVRPFSDAIYESDYFPWSHLVTGTQGNAPSYDPLQIFVEQAHARGMAIEAWINPYRVQLTSTLPVLCDAHPAIANADWAVQVGDGLYYNPALPQVQQYIIDGTIEILDRYDVDGVQFDDYFYPTTDASFDADAYAQYGNGQALDVWRRENVNTLVRNVYSAIKAHSPNVQFGISPQGNNDQNYNAQYSDVMLWMNSTGYVDYVMPQVYWGYGYTLKNGSQQFAFENIVRFWSSAPRDASVSLAFGLGAYRIGAGDGGANDQSQWSTGDNLAKMVATLAQETGVKGYGIYRYDSLFQNTEYTALTTAEIAALRALLGA